MHLLQRPAGHKRCKKLLIVQQPCFSFKANFLPRMCPCKSTTVWTSVSTDTCDSGRECAEIPLQTTNRNENSSRASIRNSTFGSRLTLGQFALLDSAGSVFVKGLEHFLPLIDVVKQLLEFVQVDCPRGIFIKNICNDNGATFRGCSPDCSSANSMYPDRSLSMLSNRA